MPHVHQNSSANVARRRHLEAAAVLAQATVARRRRLESDLDERSLRRCQLSYFSFSVYECSALSWVVLSTYVWSKVLLDSCFLGGIVTSGELLCVWRDWWGFIQWGIDAHWQKMITWHKFTSYFQYELIGISFPKGGGNLRSLCTNRYKWNGNYTGTM